MALGLVAALLLAGCGGSDSQSGDAPRPQTAPTEARPAASDFVRRVDGLCKSANPALRAINTALIQARDRARAGEVGAPKTFEAFARLLGRAGAVTRRFEARLREIPAPPSERQFHAALLASLQEGSANLRRQVSAAERQDAARLRDLSEQGSLNNARTKGLIEGHGGFRFCGRG